MKVPSRSRPWGVVLAVAAQRLAEVAWSRRNERRLIEAGARRSGQGHYPAMVGVHAGWLCGTALEGRRPARPAGLWFFGAGQVLRLWCIGSLGRRWTTTIVVPGEPKVVGGPYRWLDHPNYLAVVVELLSLPLAFRARRTAIVAGLANAVVLAVRIRAENSAWRDDDQWSGPTQNSLPSGSR